MTMNTFPKAICNNFTFGGHCHCHKSWSFPLPPTLLQRLRDNPLQLPVDGTKLSAAHCSTSSIVSASTQSRKVLVFALLSFSFAIVNPFLYMKDVAIRSFGWSQGPQARGPLTIRPKFLHTFSAAKRSSRKKVSHFSVAKRPSGKKSRLFSVDKRPK